MNDSVPYEELRNIYSKYFSLGNLDQKIELKFELISLICYMKYKVSLQKPDVTYYKIIKYLAEVDMNESFIKGLSIICEDFGYGCKEFPTYGYTGKDIPKRIKEILSTWLPF